MYDLNKFGRKNGHFFYLLQFKSKFNKKKSSHRMACELLNANGRLSNNANLFLSADSYCRYEATFVHFKISKQPLWTDGIRRMEPFTICACAWRYASIFRMQIQSHNTINYRYNSQAHADPCILCVCVCLQSFQFNHSKKSICTFF